MVCSVAFLGCDTQNQQDDFAEEASRPPARITVRDREGNTGERDEDDWRTAPVYRGVVLVEPAYPNPSNAEFITVPFTIYQFGGVRGGMVLRAYNPNGQFIMLDNIPEATSPGGYSFTFSPGLLSTKGLHRVYLFDGAGEIVSYGDVLIE